MKFTVSPEADRELTEAIEFYGQRSKLASSDFAAEVKKVFVRLKKFPKSGNELLPGYRRSLVHSFPYSVIYRIDNEELMVTAIAHQSRRPNYWENR
jgi:plasmid stabilization system protein ParE